MTKRSDKVGRLHSTFNTRKSALQVFSGPVSANAGLAECLKWSYQPCISLPAQQLLWLPDIYSQDDRSLLAFLDSLLFLLI